MMRKDEFLRRLEELLSDVSEEERNEAMAFYYDYFEDAGVENEVSVIRELGSPGRIAAEIKAGLQSDPNAGEYTDTGYHSTGTGHDSVHNGHRPVRYGQNRQQKKTKQMDNGVKILLLIGLAVLTFPIWGSLLGIIASIFMMLCAVYAHGIVPFLDAQKEYKFAMFFNRKRLINTLKNMGVKA